MLGPLLRPEPAWGVGTGSRPGGSILPVFSLRAAGGHLLRFLLSDSGPGLPRAGRGLAGWQRGRVGPMTLVSPHRPSSTWRGLGLAATWRASE